MIVAPLIRRTQIMMERRAADRQVARHIRTRPARIRVCWDLDNTLVASGELLQAGKRLDEAIVDAEPMPNMLEFISELRARLPDAAACRAAGRRRPARGGTGAGHERLADQIQRSDRERERVPRSGRGREIAGLERARTRISARRHRRSPLQPRREDAPRLRRARGSGTGFGERVRGLRRDR